MQLESLSDWIVFFNSENKIHEFGHWSVIAHSHDDKHSTLLFEKYNHRNPSVDHPMEIDQYIIPNDRQSNKLFSNILFLADFEFSLEKIIYALMHVKLEKNGAAFTGLLNGAEIALMKFKVEE